MARWLLELCKMKTVQLNPSGAMVQGARLMFFPLLLAGVLHAGVIPADRSIDWSQAGVAGGIPNVTTIYTNMTGLDNTGATDVSGAITTQLWTAPSNSVVLLPAGKFLLTGTISMNNGVVLRGQGASTVLIGNVNGIIINFYGPYSWWDRTNLLSGYTKGSTNLVVSGVPSDMAVGTKIQITQLNDPSFVNPWNWASNSVEGEYLMGQYVKVTAINGTNLTVWPPLYMSYSNADSPIIFFPANQNNYGNNMMEHAGVENLVVSNINAGAYVVNFSMSFASQCWLKNVQSWWASIDHITTYDTYRCEIRDSQFIGVTAPITSSRGYGLQIGTPNSPNPSMKTTALLCENNVFAMCRGGIIPGYGAAGCVFGYNFFANETNEDTSILRSDIYIHSAHPVMNLFEGNVGSEMQGDDEHGSSGYNVIFRNYWRGRDSANIAVSSLRSVEMDAWQRYYSVVGNVLGYPGVSNDMAVLTGPTGGAVYIAIEGVSWSYNHWYKALMFGWDGEGGGTSAYDTNVFLTTLVTGNYDYVQNQTTWDTNGVQTLPSSLYLASQPAWWTASGSTPFPPIGSDRTPMVSSIPAQLRFNATQAGTQTFGAGTQTLSPPTSLAVQALTVQALTVQSPTVQSPTVPASGGGGGGGTTYIVKDYYTNIISAAIQFSYYWSAADKWIGSARFLASNSYTLTRVDASLAKVGTPTFNLRAHVYSDSNGSLGSSLGTVSSFVSGNQSGLVQFTNMSVTITSGSVYWIVLESDVTRGDGANYQTWNYSFDAGNGPSYTHGNFITYSSP
jgi:hypothetical protein